MSGVVAGVVLPNGSALTGVQALVVIVGVLVICAAVVRMITGTKMRGSTIMLAAGTLWVLFFLCLWRTLG